MKFDVRRATFQVARNLAVLLALSARLVGCGEQQPAPALAAAESDGVMAQVEVVDLRGQPLPGMTPIATTTSNAFDKPAVVGQPTDLSGRGELRLPAHLRLYVRAWDPNRGWFANNYFDVPPGRATHTPLMRIEMVRSASLDAVLLGPDNAPASNTNVGLMMFHPTKGAWWPDEADTDANGVVHFPALPAGTYTLKLKALGVGTLDIPSVELPPGGKADLGVVVLQ